MVFLLEKEGGWGVYLEVPASKWFDDDMGDRGGVLLDKSEKWIECFSLEWKGRGGSIA